MVDFGCTIVLGLIQDGLIQPPQDWFKIDDLDFRAWLKKHGAHDETIACPLVTETRALMDDVRTFTREANREMKRVEAVTERVHDVADGVFRIVTAVAGITRAGQLVSLAVGIRKGLDVFVQRLRRGQGGQHG